MNHLLTHRRTLALLLIVAVMTARIGSFSYERFVQPIQSYISKAPFLAEGETTGKIPIVKLKRSLLDVASMLSMEDLIKRPQPALSLLISFQPFVRLPEVYLEKFDPPDPVRASSAAG
jgi:hypothetical protein